MWVQQPHARNPVGAVDLLSLWSSEDLLSNLIGFVATVQYELGRPYFATEGWNADTEFDVWGSASVSLWARLTVDYLQPTEPPIPTPPTEAAPEVPEPSTYFLVGMPLIAFGLLRRKKVG